MTRQKGLTIFLKINRIGNMGKEIRAVILAAGKSTRMKSDFSKVTHKILGKEIINYLLDSLVDAGIRENDIVIVCGENIDELKKVVNRDVKYAIQHQQLGTADALLSAREFIKDFTGDLLVTVGDNPYINALELKRLILWHQKVDSHCTFISAVFPSNPPPYGRILRDKENRVIGVKEEIEASPEELKIKEVNSSIYMFDNRVVFPLLSQINNDNEKGFDSDQQAPVSVFYSCKTQPPQ